MYEVVNIIYYQNEKYTVCVWTMNNLIIYANRWLFTERKYTLS